MMRKLKYLILLVLITIPIKVNASIKVGGQAPNFSIEGENAYCISPGLEAPSVVTSVEKFGDSYLDTAYLGVYRLALITPSNNWHTETMRNSLISMGYSAYLGEDAILAQSLAYVYAKVNGSIGQFPWPAYSTKLACGGLYAVGKEGMLKSCDALDLSTCAANDLLSFNDCRVQLNEYSTETLNWLKKKVSEFNPKFVIDKDKTDASNGEYVLKLDGVEYENVKGVLSDSRFSALAGRSKIEVIGCEVVNNASLTCSVNRQDMLLNNELRVKINGNDLANQNLSIKIKYIYDFPFAGSSAKIYYTDGAYTQKLIVPYSSSPEQKEQIVNINYQTPPVQACQTTIKDGKRIYLYNNNEISLKDFIDKCGCNSVPIEDILKDEESTKIYNEFCGKQEIKKCEVKNINNQRKYYNNGNEVSLKEYINVGCCADINAEDLNKATDANELYQNMCAISDTVYIENECGSKAKIGKKEYVINNGVNTELLTCENESYIDYSHSYVWQLNMDKVLERVKKTESGENNIEGIYNTPAIANYTDKSYTSNAIIGKNGQSINGISASNNYCTLLTSENNDIYFPGTAIATSGRFFVFNELNKEECTNSINPGPNCFRQPYIDGNITAVMHTNFDKWNNDYKKAIEAEKEAYRAYQNDQSITNEQLYNIAMSNRKQLEKYKTECETRNNLENYWTYNLNPSLNFTYAQKVYGGKNNSEVIKETVSMTKSNESVRYWPNVSSNINCTYDKSKGQNVTYTINYGNVHETKTFTNIENYTAKCDQRVYYRPNQVAYSTIPSGKYILSDARYQTNPVNMLSNGVEIGYVYNVRLTTYEGTYTTSFTVDNLGHQGFNNTSNIQKSLDKYKLDNNLIEISSECVYCNQEGEFKRVCEVCDPDTPELSASYIYRTVSLSNINPNNRENTNWTDKKGASAEKKIESLSGDNVAANLDLSETNVKMVANDNIYDDYSRDYIEYEFNLTPKDMQIIRNNTRNTDFNYGDISVCNSANRITDRNEDVTYCYICNSDGKECISSFIDAFAESDTTDITRKEKWKYFINGNWEIGSWKDIVQKYTNLEGFENGRYPDPLNPDAYLKKYYNWP